MKNVRSIPRILLPVPGESFSSYVERLAAKHKVDLLVMLDSLGIIGEEKYERLNGYGILLGEKELAQFCVATALRKEQVAAMLLSAYDGIAFDLEGARLGDTEKLRQRAQVEWAYFSGSHACPHCLEDDSGAWQLSWKLPWAIVCPRHNCYLVSHCPACERRLSSGRADRSLSPLYVRQVPTPKYCRNPKPHGVGRMGRSSLPCGHALTTIPTLHAGKTTLAIQKLLNAALAGQPPKVLGETGSARDYFHDLRTICALILYCAEAEDLGKLLAPELAAFADFTDKRNKLWIDRMESAAPRKSARTRVFYGPQDNPALMAAVCTLATRILSAENVQTMSEMFHPLAARCFARPGKIRWEILQFFRFSDRIAPAFQECLAEKATFNRSIGRLSQEAVQSKYKFNPRHVPQLISLADYQEMFAELLPDMHSNHARSYVSMSLIKLCGDFTWLQAAELLGLPTGRAKSIANRAVVLLNLRGQRKAFGKRLHALANRLSEAPEKIDYQWRRAQLHSLTEIPWVQWNMLCDESGVTPGLRGGRNRYAAAWLWASLTSGDWTLAPALEGRHLINTREVYRQMEKKIFPKLEVALWNHGAALLNEAGYTTFKS